MDSQLARFRDLADKFLLPAPAEIWQHLFGHSLFPGRDPSSVVTKDILVSSFG